MIDFTEELPATNWRIYKSNLETKHLDRADYLGMMESEKFLSTHPDILIEVLCYFSQQLKERIVKNPEDTITMTYTPLNKDGTYHSRESICYDLVELVDEFISLLAIQCNYRAGEEINIIKEKNMFNPIVAEIKNGASFEARDGSRGSIYDVNFDLINRDVVVFKVKDTDDKERGFYYGEIHNLYRDFKRLGELDFSDIETNTTFFDKLAQSKQV